MLKAMSDKDKSWHLTSQTDKSSICYPKGVLGGDVKSDVTDLLEDLLTLYDKDKSTIC